MIIYITSHVEDFKGAPVVRLAGNEVFSLRVPAADQHQANIYENKQNELYYQVNNVFLFKRLYQNLYDLH